MSLSTCHFFSLECFKIVSRVFQESFKGVSRKIEWCFMGDFSEFQGYLKEVPRNFQIVSKEFQGSLKGVL